MASSCVNPAQLTVPNGWSAEFNGFVNAGFEQIVTISQNGTTLHTFSGSGENNTPFPSNPFTWTSNGEPIDILFQANNGSGAQNVTIATCITHIGSTVGVAEYTTEDWVDGDNNDTILSVVMQIV